jgi:hypothetical protein
VTARTDAQARLERIPVTVVEMDLDYCSNTFGVSPCTAGRKDSGTAQAGAARTITLRAGASAVDGFYVPMTVRIVSGTGSGQERRAGDYVGSTKVLTIAASEPDFSPAPNGTSVYDVIDRPNGCYNVFLGDSPCQDTANFVKGTKTIKLGDRGMPIPAGEQIRPYLLKAGPTPTVIDTAKGLAMPSRPSLTFTDEPCRDDLDKYIDDRLAPAGGTFWTRLIARNPNAIGRFARVRKGYVVSPWDWNTFQTELYAIDAIRGPDASWRITLVLSDAIKLLDRNKVPKVTDGKLIVALPATSFSGVAAGGSATTIVLPGSASAVDDFYNGEEVAILQNTGAGQRKVASDYVGATRTLTVPAWAVIPDSTSVIEVAPLKLTLGTGKGAQYTDPATSGKNEYGRIGDEVIRYTAKAGDVLSWTDGTYRAQFGTAREDHKVNDVVVLCRAWIDKPAKEVIEDLINEAGLADTYIDLAGLATEDTNWLSGGRITACIADPEQASTLLAELLRDLLMMSWWHPVEQKVKFKVDMPELLTSVTLIDTNKLMLDKTASARLDAERITQSWIDFSLRFATADEDKRASYQNIRGIIDASAESANGYGDVRPSLPRSRWFTAANENLAASNAARKLARLRDAPSRITFHLDPLHEVGLSQLVDVKTPKLTDAAGNAKTVRCRVVKLTDLGGHFEAEAQTTIFARRYAFICPNGYPNYPSATADQRQRAFISNGATMSDGTSAYLIS